MMRTILLLPFLIALLPWHAAAQSSSESLATEDALLLGLSYGAQLPVGDLADRFGAGFGAEGSLDYLWSSSTWSAGLQGMYFFGNNVKEDVLVNLRTSDGFIIGNDRDPAEVALRQRGLYLGGRLGYTLPVGTQPRSGFHFKLGGGLLLHRIRVQRDPARTVNQVLADYSAGYDRLTTGPALYQFIGWQSLSSDGRANFFVGLEAYEGFTRGRRSFDFAAGRPLDESRLDVLVGLRLGWILPFYFRPASEIYY